MQIQQYDAGDYQICAGAVERGLGAAFQATLVVTRIGCQGQWIEVYREDQVGGGFLWNCPQEALTFALERGKDVVMCRSAAGLGSVR
ncbi:MAG: hypothetical protein ACK520_18240 [Inhella sp.]|jgi:hypothetical protein|uniref:hypothetical protein n=1 Tax=Inhella sp. TaxID=1921806 RepID=UPI0022C3AAA6|nr:hypothetical protein [Polaromonas sp.]